MNKIKEKITASENVWHLFDLLESSVAVPFGKPNWKNMLRSFLSSVSSFLELRSRMKQESEVAHLESFGIPKGRTYAFKDLTRRQRVLSVHGTTLHLGSFASKLRAVYNRG